MSRNPQEIASDLTRLVKGEVYADIVHRAAYSIDASIYRIMPQCVVVPKGPEDVQAVMRYAAAESISVVARGAGSGVAGESLGNGIVLDLTCHMRRVIDTGTDGGRVTCEPGVVLEDLNRMLARVGRTIGPDPSSANRATVGGSVANNATGAHSMNYGHMADHVSGLDVILSDGERVNLRNGARPDGSAKDRQAVLTRQCLQIISQNAAVIDRAVPKARRARIGYQVQGVSRGGALDMAKLLAGSEGTLAVFVEISLDTVQLPPAKALLQLEFGSLQAMAEAVPLIVQTSPSACELMDRMLMDMAVSALPRYRDLFPPEAAAVLMVEHIGENAAQVAEKLRQTDKAVGAIARGRRTVSDPVEQRRMWKSRTDAVPLLYRRKGRRQPVPFIEDACVNPEHLGGYLSGLEQIGQKQGVSLCYYGHAGDGEMHVRPYLDLGKMEDIQAMKAMAEEVFGLVWSLGGSISGEHAYGLVRAGFVRRQFGDGYVDVLRQIKQAFDPKGLLNPGKVLNDDPDVMTRNLKRSHVFIAERTRSDLHLEPDEMVLEAIQCNGCGLCRSHGSDQRMCPVFQALGQELASPRGKANLLDAWATGQIDFTPSESDQFARAIDLCIHCKACSRQCPSGVDVSKLMLAAKTEWVRRTGLRRAELALASNRRLAAFGALLAPVANPVMASRISRKVMQAAVGLDAGRRMPAFKWGSFGRVGRRFLDRLGPVDSPVDKAVYLPDTYATYYNHALGLAVLRVLRANAIQVELPVLRPVPLPAMNYGDIRLAKADLAHLVRRLAPWIRKGYKVICSEPSAAMALRQDLRHFVDSPDAQLVSQEVFELMDYLLGLHRAGRLRTPPQGRSREYAYHEPCHLLALTESQPGVQLIKGLCNGRVADLKAGCCGLAGSYGMQKAHGLLSEQISQRLQAALACHPEKTVLTECSACRMQIEHVAKAGVVVAHPVEVLAAAYAGEGPNGA